MKQRVDEVDNNDLILDNVKAIANTSVPEELLASYTTEFKKSMDIYPDRTTSLTDNTVIFAHNSYNGPSTGAYMPNQGLSITDLLNIGVRGIELDVHNTQGEVRLCHEFCTPDSMSFLGYNRKFSDALEEIQKWASHNPSEVILLKIEDWVDIKK